MLRLLQHRRNLWLQRQLRGFQCWPSRNDWHLMFPLYLSLSKIHLFAYNKLPSFFLYFFKPALFRATTLQTVSPGYTHEHWAELGKYKLQVTKHKVGYDTSIKQKHSNSKQTVANDCHTYEKVNKSIVYRGYLLQFLRHSIEDTNTLVGRRPTPVNCCLGVQFDRLYLRMHHSFSGSPFCERSAR